MPFKFYCRNCYQKLEAPESLYGKEVPCPRCGQSVAVPDPRQQQRPNGNLKLVTMSCPLCGAPRLTMPDARYGNAVCPGCHAIFPLQPKSDENPAATELPAMRDYLLVRKLGSGGSGIVYEGRQIKLNNRGVAVKILNPELAARWDIATEAAALVRLAHPCIVRLYDIAEEPNCKGLVMELVTAPHGEPLSLRDVLVANGNRLPLEAAVKACLTIAAALQYAHRQNVLHLDLKPENILIDHLGALRIVDFGIAKVRPLEPSRDPITLRTVANEGFGTPGYDAPERREPNHQTSPRLDIYSLGAILYEAATGNLPGGRFPLPSEVDRNLPKALDNVVETALHFHPEKRYQEMGQFSEALHNLLQQIKAAGTPQPLEVEAETNTVQIKFTRSAATPAVSHFTNALKMNGSPRRRVAGGVTVLLILGIIVTATLWLLQSRNQTAKEETFFTANPSSKHSADPSPASKTATPAPTVAVPTTPEQLYLAAEACYWGDHQPSDPGKALALLRQAAAAGHAEAMNRLGEMLFYGDAGIRAPEEAAEWFQKAANLRCPKAFFNLGECYYYGLCGLRQDYRTAVEYYQKGIGAGSVHSLYGLARCYGYGHGVVKNPLRANALLNQAYEAGYLPAKDLLAKLKESAQP